ncbi:hypothetical protein HDE77_003564 [Rhodanobacter sp. MP7CTX1]|jgi:hypothetical protein|nr:hypothetical protein [Rhodanobacter sp. MP7CTX1]
MTTSGATAAHRSAPLIVANPHGTLTLPPLRGESWSEGTRLPCTISDQTA